MSRSVRGRCFLERYAIAQKPERGLPVRRTCFSLILTLGAPLVGAAPESLPILYEINAPFYYQEPYTVTVHQTVDLSVGVANPADRSPFRDTEGDSKTLVYAGVPYAAGPRTGGRLAKGQRLNRWYFRINEPQPLEEGTHYSRMYDPADPRDVPYEREWWVENLAVDWQRGDEDAEVAGLAARHYTLAVSYDYRRIDHDDGERTEEHVESRRDFWFSERFPFSPLQMLPLQIGNDQRFVCFCSQAGERVNQAVYARLEDKLRAAGMLLRTRLESSDGPATVEVSRVQTVPDLDVTSYAHWPAIPESQDRVAAGALVLAEMLSQAPAGKGSAAIRFDTGEATPLALQADSSYFRVNDIGDLAIASMFNDGEGVEGMLMLMRPHHGAPKVGRYDTGAQASTDKLKVMSTETLKAQAQRYQAVAVIEQGDSLTIYSSTDTGSVTIDDVTDGSIAGSFDLTMEAVDTFGDGSVQQRQVSGEFEAAIGLKARMRSPTSRLLSRGEP